MVKQKETLNSRFCDLECDTKVKPKSSDTPIHEYLGPVKIVLIDPDPKVYKRVRLGTACLAISQLMMGATIAMVFLFVLSLHMSFPMSAHIVLCTSGYQLLLPMSILLPGGRETASVPLTQWDKRKQHFYMSFIGCAFGIVGTFVAKFLKYDPKNPRGLITCKLCHDTVFGTKSLLNITDLDVETYVNLNLSLHAITAWLTLAVVFIAIVSGILGMLLSVNHVLGKLYIGLHSLIGIVCMLSASTCFALGLWEGDYFRWWLGCSRIPEGIYILTFFCVVYTLSVVIFPIGRILTGYKKGP